MCRNHRATWIDNTLHSDKTPDGSINRHNPSLHDVERQPTGTGATNTGSQAHSLFVGSRDGKAFSNVDREAMINTATASFDCFTVVDANGYFQGRSVATLIIKIGTEDSSAIEALGHELGHLLNQEAIGLETAGIYRSITVD